MPDAITIAVRAEIGRGRVVIAHLGSGSSMCAVEDGRSVDSTMGFTALDGLPMGTRCGQLDAGVVPQPSGDADHCRRHVRDLAGAEALVDELRAAPVDRAQAGRAADAVDLALRNQSEATRARQSLSSDRARNAARLTLV